jgi:ABC-type glutathione transport system ATPase component
MDALPGTTMTSSFDPSVRRWGARFCRPARVLSVSEQQRLALARAWALEPSVLFADAPTGCSRPPGSKPSRTTR